VVDVHEERAGLVASSRDDSDHPLGLDRI
jgi:hypothetical protein